MERSNSGQKHQKRHQGDSENPQGGFPSPGVPINSQKSSSKPKNTKPPKSKSKKVNRKSRSTNNQRKIYVCEIPKGMSVSGLKKLLVKFGAIQNAYFCKQRGKGEFVYGFVVFKKMAGKRKALKAGFVSFDGGKILLKNAADESGSESLKQQESARKGSGRVKIEGGSQNNQANRQNVKLKNNIQIGAERQRREKKASLANQPRGAASDFLESFSHGSGRPKLINFDERLFSSAPSKLALKRGSLQTLVSQLQKESPEAPQANSCSAKITKIELAGNRLLQSLGVSFKPCRILSKLLDNGLLEKVHINHLQLANLRLNTPNLKKTHKISFDSDTGPNRGSRAPGHFAVSAYNNQRRRMLN